MQLDYGWSMNCICDGAVVQRVKTTMLRLLKNPLLVPVKIMFHDSIHYDYHVNDSIQFYVTMHHDYF